MSPLGKLSGRLHACAAVREPSATQGPISRSTLLPSSTRLDYQVRAHQKVELVRDQTGHHHWLRAEPEFLLTRNGTRDPSGPVPEVEGQGAECPFPRSSTSWVAKSNDSSSDMIARQTLHISLTLPPSRKGEAFDVTDARRPESWCSKWPGLCGYFWLRGTPPRAAGDLEVRKYIHDHFDRWEVDGSEIWAAAWNRQFRWNIPEIQFGFDGQHDMTKMYETTGFQEERTTIQAWAGIFDRMSPAKIIPQGRVLRPQYNAADSGYESQQYAVRRPANPSIF
ncbi:hypothetical protein LTR72_011879 [Exophiala xenobiotica]|nr:hypothetical protein LTR72_011879 [Exophiala xenobiotica]KAK5332863.1 hypothetical protein LTR98_011020 [Exophiala xenobiotica]